MKFKRNSKENLLISSFLSFQPFARGTYSERNMSVQKARISLKWIVIYGEMDYFFRCDNMVEESDYLVQNPSDVVRELFPQGTEFSEVATSNGFGWVEVQFDGLLTGNEVARMCDEVKLYDRGLSLITVRHEIREQIQNVTIAFVGFGIAT